MTDFVFKGKCWCAGDFIPTDQIIKTQRIYMPMEEVARFVLEDANPRFGREVQSGDILVAGRHFGQSSGRAVAVKALIATGISCVIAEYFSRTFFRNAFEVGLPVLEVPGILSAVEEGDLLEVDIGGGRVTNIRSGNVAKGNPIDPFLLNMLKAGGIIAMAPKLVGETE